MENLGSMEPEELLQLFSGSLGCAVAIFLFLVVYVLVTRRGNKSKRRVIPDATGLKQEPLSHGYSAQPSPVPTAPADAIHLVQPEPEGSAEQDESSIDVGARLAGTGREAWLGDRAVHPDQIDAYETYLPHRAQEVLRLVRDPNAGEVWIHIAGMRYRSLTDIRDRAVGERALAAVTCALRFSGGMAASDQGPVALQVPDWDLVTVPSPFGMLAQARQPGEIMRLMSDPGQNEFCIHVLDRCYRRLVDVSDRAVGQHILEGISRLLQFSHGMLATNDGFGTVSVPSLRAEAYTPLPEPPGLSPPLSPSTVTATSPSEPILGARPPVSASPEASVGASLSEQERFLKELQSQMPSQPRAPVERPTLMGSLRRMRDKPGVESLPSLDLAGEIDRIFQSKLVASGMATTDARVESNPDGSVRIRVGTAYYNSPNDVPDPIVREMLKLAIAEWERS